MRGEDPAQGTGALNSPSLASADEDVMLRTGTSRLAVKTLPSVSPNDSFFDGIGISVGNRTRLFKHLQGKLLGKSYRNGELGEVRVGPRVFDEMRVRLTPKDVAPFAILKDVVEGARWFRREPDIGRQGKFVFHTATPFLLDGVPHVAHMTLKQEGKQGNRHLSVYAINAFEMRDGAAILHRLPSASADGAPDVFEDERGMPQDVSTARFGTLYDWLSEVKDFGDRLPADRTKLLQDAAPAPAADVSVLHQETPPPAQDAAVVERLEFAPENDYPSDIVSKVSARMADAAAARGDGLVGVTVYLRSELHAVLIGDEAGVSSVVWFPASELAGRPNAAAEEIRGFIKNIHYRASSTGSPALSVNILAAADEGAARAAERIPLLPETESMRDVRERYQGTPGWMKAPNGEATNLSERQWLQVRTEEFKAWFGDWENDPANASVAVDANGEPKLFYHGMRGRLLFDTFEADKNKFGGMMFFSDNRLTSLSYADHAVYPVFLNVRNAEFHDAGGRVWNKLEYRTEDGRPLPKTDQIGEHAKAQGKDGVIIDNVLDYVLNPDMRKADMEIAARPSTDVIVFRPEQIKSAIGNDGAFSQDNPSILHQNVRGNVTISRRTLDAVIRIFKGADLSTVVHEGAHVFGTWLVAAAESGGSFARQAFSRDVLAQGLGAGGFGVDIMGGAATVQDVRSAIARARRAEADMETNIADLGRIANRRPKAGDPAVQAEAAQARADRADLREMLRTSRARRALMERYVRHMDNMEQAREDVLALKRFAGLADDADLAGVSPASRRGRHDRCRKSRFLLTVSAFTHMDALPRGFRSAVPDAPRMSLRGENGHCALQGPVR